jgi:hypothetical protein
MEQIIIDHKKDMDKLRTEYESTDRSTLAELENSIAENDAKVEEVCIECW